MSSVLDRLPQGTSDITKLLRSRDIPLSSLLPVAENLFVQPENLPSVVFFPRANEWLLEWLLQRLKEDDGQSGAEARTSPEFWQFLLRLLRSCSAAVVAGVLKRHGLPSTLAKTFQELVDGAGDVFSTPKENASPANDNVEVAVADRTVRLLDAITVALQYLHELGNAEASIRAVLRGTPEVCSIILGSFLKTLTELSEREQRVNEHWVDMVLGLWKGSIWGNPNLKKISAIWAASCLQPAAALLSAPNISIALKSRLEELIAEYLFSPKILYPQTESIKAGSVRPLQKDLIPLLAILKNEGAAAPSAISVLLKIALTSLNKGGLDSDIVQALFTAFLKGILGLDLAQEPHISSDAPERVASLLKVILDTSNALPETILSLIIRNLGNLDTSQTNWRIVELVLRLDFDALIHPSNSQLLDKVFFGLSSSQHESDDTFRVLQLLVDAFVTARDLQSFIDRWQSQLSHASIWKSDRLAAIVANTLERALTPKQVEVLVQRLTASRQWVILDAVLRGIEDPRYEWELLRALPLIVTASLDDKEDWRTWRLLVRVQGIAKTYTMRVLPDAVSVIKAGRLRESVFATLLLMRVVEDNPSNLDAVLGGIRQALNIATVSLRKNASWSGVIDSINDETFGIAMAMALAVASDIKSLDFVDMATKQEFLSAFFDAAAEHRDSVSTVSIRESWRSMLKDGNLYETGVKDSLLVILVSKLDPYSSVTGDQSSTSKASESPSTKALQRYALVLESLQCYPNSAMKKGTREKIIDSLYFADQAGLRGIPPLMNKLWKVGNAGTCLATNAESLKRWFKTEHSESIEHSRSREEVGRSVIVFALQASGDKNHRFLTEAVNIASLSLRESPSTLGILRMASVIIGKLWEFRLSTLQAARTTIESLRSRFLTTIEEAIRDENRIEGQLVHWWREISELEPIGIRQTQRVVYGVTDAILPLLGEARPSHQSLFHEAVSLVFSVCDVTVDSVTRAAALGLVAWKSLDERSKEDSLVQFGLLVRKIQSSEPVVYQEVLQCFLSGCLSDNEDLGEGVWAYLTEMLRDAENPQKSQNVSENSTSTIINTALTSAHVHLALRLSHSSSITAFRATSECIDILVGHKPWCVVQHSIDTTLGAITAALSPSATSFLVANPDDLYFPLTHILISIFSLHRYRIRGRYHVVIQLLQRMLTVLFTPRSTRKKDEVPSHPPWLTPTCTLSVTSARAFARVMERLCQPPSSTVRSRNSELVNSETVREKRYVREVVGPWLASYVKNTLEMGMPVEVRMEVLGAVRVVLKVLGRDGVQEVTNGLDPAGRAIVRGLWKEEREVGGVV